MQLCSLNPDDPVDRYINAPSTGALYKIHLPASPEGFLAQLIQPFVIRRDPATLCALLSSLNGCLQDPAVYPRVKLHILNVENGLLRQSVITDLPKDQASVGHEFCAFRRTLVLDVIDNPARYFGVQDIAANEPRLPSLHTLYVDTERDLYLRVGQREAVMPFFDDLMTATRPRRAILAGVLRSAIAANHRATLITAEAMRERLDRCRESLDHNDLEQLNRMIEYGIAQEDMEIRDMTVQLAHATFRGTDPSEIYTVIQFALPKSLKRGASEVMQRGGLPGGVGFEIAFRQVTSSYEDPSITYLANIGSEEIGGLPSSFMSDVDPSLQAGSALVQVKLDRFMGLDFEVAPDGSIVDMPFEDEKALRGGQYYPHKELIVGLLRGLFREQPNEFPIDCQLEDLHIDAFSNYLVDYRLSPKKGMGNIIIHRKSYLLTRRDAFRQACIRYSDEISALYRHDEQVSLKALMENSVIRTNESLRDFIYKVLKLTVKEYVERHSCWDYLWEGDPKRPRPETHVHPFINSHLRAALEMKGVRVSRETPMANGAVDFFCSFTTPRGDVLKVCIEVKNAHSAGLESGIAKQLPAYMGAEQTGHGIYLVFWYKSLDWPNPAEFKSIDELTVKLETVKPKEDYCIDVMVVNCTKPLSPSKI